MPIDKIIVLEDDLYVRRSLEDHLRNRRFEVAATDTIAAAEEFLSKDSFDLMLLDIRLPDGDGIELLKALQTRPQKPLVVVMTGFGSVESAVECMKNGAFDYLTKPFSTNQLDITVKRAQDFTQLVRVNQILSQEEGENHYDLLGQSVAMEELRSLIRKVARTNATVLIQGESGTGKELVARTIYMESPRNGAPFIKINCAAVPENLIESEFFGHEKGAFTGAICKREGRFELAHGGTILLDEVSEISPTVQAKLLRFLQERELERVGGNKTIRVDVRVIATTNRHLEQSVQRKEFRQDLFFRLNVVPIHVPPLRERREDIFFLAEQFLKRYTRKHGVRIKGIGDRSRDALFQHDWPGNVRELQNVIERAVILCNDDDLVEPEHLGLVTGAAPTAVGDGVTAAMTSTSAPAALNPHAPLPSLAELEKQHIFVALERCRDNRTQAAKLLGISIRTLRNKLNEYSGKTPRNVESAETDAD